MSTGRPASSDRQFRRRLGVSGLTLVELLVVMVIMVLLAGVTAPSMVVAHREARIRAAARQVLSRLHYARSRAVSSRTTTRFNVRGPEAGAAEPAVLWVSTQKDDQRTQEPTFETDTTPSGRARALPQGIRLEIVKKQNEQLPPTQATGDDEDLVTLTFWRNGQTEDALLVLSDAQTQQRYVRLNALTGRPKLMDEEDLAKDELGKELAR